MECLILSYHDPKFEEGRTIRESVFMRQSDQLDPICTQYLFSQDGRNIGTARSHLDGDVVKIDNFAFIPEARGLGLGAEAFSLIIRDCMNRYPGQPITVDAQTYLQRFYERLGFLATSDPYHNDGVEHIVMKYNASWI